MLGQYLLHKTRRDVIQPGWLGWLVLTEFCHRGRDAVLLRASKVGVLVRQYARAHSSAGLLPGGSPFAAHLRFFAPFSMPSAVQMLGSLWRVHHRPLIHIWQHRRPLLQTRQRLDIPCLNACGLLRRCWRLLVHKRALHLCHEERICGVEVARAQIRHLVPRRPPPTRNSLPHFQFVGPGERGSSHALKLGTPSLHRGARRPVTGHHAL